MKLAHLLLVHKSPQQVKRLITRLCHKDSDIYIHIDLKCDIAEYENLIAENIYFIKNRISVNWGGYSILQATLNGFEEILSNGVSYSHINLLSGQDYLLKDISHVQDFLFKNADKSFMEYRSMDEKWKNGQIRIHKYSFGDFSFPKKYLVERVANSLMPKRKMPLNLKPYGRSNWITITPTSAQYVIDYLKKHPSVRRFFKLTWAAEEVAIQTILLNSPLRKTIVNNNLRYIELGDNIHPRVLTSTDISLLLNSGKLFARKFDFIIDEEIFDHLDVSNSA
jgi:hypothetical protein